MQGNGNKNAGSQSVAEGDKEELSPKERKRLGRIAYNKKNATVKKVAYHLGVTMAEARRQLGIVKP